MEILEEPSRKKAPKKFTRDQVLTNSINYFEGDELAATTWMNKYAMRNLEGEWLESNPNDMHQRMAIQFARIEKFYIHRTHLNGNRSFLSDYGKNRDELTEKKIYSLFKDFKYVVPQGSVMSSLGNPYVLASLSNCVVMPTIEDSYGGVFKTDQQLAQLFKRRCGVGIDISSLRPQGAQVSNAAGTTSGAVSFMERFSNTTREVAQNGRRGALMLTMDISHPDIEDFIAIKQDLTKVTGANISVRLSDAFMKAVEKKQMYELKWPVDAKNPLFKKKVNAETLWHKIVSCAHNTAEPGLIFWDRQHYYSTSSVYPKYKNTSTNPCSEIAMQGGDSCRLIALNLFSFVDDPFTNSARFNFSKFYAYTYEAQRLMDDLVDLELEAIDRILTKVISDPESEQVKAEEVATWKLLYETGKKGRRTGLGITALADTIAALGFELGSDKALEMVEMISKEKCRAEFDSSIDMAIERGAFEDFDVDIENTSAFVLMLREELPEIYQRMMKHGRRNISISTVAPTGTLSMLTQTSSGIEPVFMLSYKRRRKVNALNTDKETHFVDEMGDHWEEFNVFHKKFEWWQNLKTEDALTVNPYYNSTANELDWKRRIEIQARIQKYVTHSISSTINLPEDTSVERVGEIYIEAWKKGLKGITVYRDGSRSGVLIANEKNNEQSVENEIIPSIAPKRPEKLEAKIVRFRNNHEKWIAVVGLLKERPYEIFTGKAEDSFTLPSHLEKGWVLKSKKEDGNSRYDFQYIDRDGYKVTIEGLSRSFDKEYWNYAKLISGILRHGMPLPYVVDVINNLSLYDDAINTWKTGVARALKMFIPDGTKAADHQCTECGDPDGLLYEEGCLKCKSCGHSKCG